LIICSLPIVVSTGPIVVSTGPIVVSTAAAIVVSPAAIVITAAAIVVPPAVIIAVIIAARKQPGRLPAPLKLVKIVFGQSAHGRILKLSRGHFG
jgi:hypothetical protein